MSKRCAGIVPFVADICGKYKTGAIDLLSLLNTRCRRACDGSDGTVTHHCVCYDFQNYNPVRMKIIGSGSLNHLCANPHVLLRGS